MRKVRLSDVPDTPEVKAYVKAVKRGMKDRGDAMKLNDLIKEAEATWAAQGRTDEQKWAVRNFLTGSFLKVESELQKLLLEARLDELNKIRYPHRVVDTWGMSIVRGKSSRLATLAEVRRDIMEHYENQIEGRIAELSKSNKSKGSVDETINS